ncbi:hypothetical protein VCHA51O444_180092 [Vibrio chagasii]|nr:hypothetical protein VCHA51O444_180092 [Vibrio chagasii]CAH7187861.1 hypothetical protein VCHA53O466_270023 [Vibrio chagasii]
MFFKIKYLSLGSDLNKRGGEKISKSLYLKGVRDVFNVCIKHEKPLYPNFIILLMYIVLICVIDNFNFNGFSYLHFQ